MKPKMIVARAENLKGWYAFLKYEDGDVPEYDAEYCEYFQRFHCKTQAINYAMRVCHDLDIFQGVIVYE
jgi:hypothetical protein